MTAYLKPAEDKDRLIHSYQSFEPIIRLVEEMLLTIQLKRRTKNAQRHRQLLCHGSNRLNTQNLI
jgi:hypothetical protein